MLYFFAINKGRIMLLRKKEVPCSPNHCGHRFASILLAKRRHRMTRGVSESHKMDDVIYEKPQNLKKNCKEIM